MTPTPQSMLPNNPAGLLELVVSRSDQQRVALARLLSFCESGELELGELNNLEFLRPHVIGLTGAPGAGKSSLIDGLISVIKSEGFRVAVIAVDPTSRESGGAFLGDRIRMTDTATDPDVFVRSMATRSHLGGLSAGVAAAIPVLGIGGFQVVILETVGVGQNEVEVRELADTVGYVLYPGFGDDVQAMKAGPMEIADIFVINKADTQPAAHGPARDATQRELLERLANIVNLLGARRQRDGWDPPVVATVANNNFGIDALWSALKKHAAHLGHQLTALPR